MWRWIFFWRHQPAALTDHADLRAGPEELARFVEVQQQLVELCKEAAEACRLPRLAFKIEDVQFEVGQWFDCFADQPPATRAKCLEQMEVASTTLKGVVPRLSGHMDADYLQKLWRTFEDLEDWFWKTRERSRPKGEVLSLEDLRPVLEGGPRPQVAPQIEKFENWLTNQTSPQSEAMWFATQAVLEVARTWDKNADKIRFRTQLTRGDFLLQQVIEACEAMQTSGHLIESEAACEKLTATMDEVARFLSTALQGIRTADEADFMNRLGAVQQQAR